MNWLLMRRGVVGVIVQAVKRLFFSSKLVFLTLTFCIFPFYSLKSYILHLLYGVKIEISGDSISTDKNYLIITNHRSWYDFFIVRSVLYKSQNDISCVGMHKAGIGYFLYALALRLRGDLYYSNNDKNCLKNNLKHLSLGLHCMLFPEGTRNRSAEGLLPFKKGIDKLIENTEEDLLLCYIKGSEKILNRGSSRVQVKVKLIQREFYRGKTVEELYRETFEIL